MAGLSTAAVVVISLLAYNLLPGLGTVNEKSAGRIESAAPQAAAGSSDLDVQFSQSVTEDKGNTSSTLNATDANSAPDGNSTGTVSQEEAALKSEAAKDTGKDKSQVTVAEEKKIKASRKTTSEEGSNKASSEGKKEDVNESREKTEMSIAAAGAAQDVGQQYFSNYVEMNLSGTSEETVMENLKNLMADLGATEQDSGLINGFTANLEGTAAYIDYSVPLSVYGSLRSEASLKYKLELQTKTDIIKKDITEEYNILENQKLDIENKISEALKEGGDTSTLEAEKSTLIKQMEELIAENDTITIRIFFVKK
jgi:hypothetical protein